jgi:Immunity protein 26
MIKKKQKVEEGDVFAVPLRSGGFAVGLVARRYKTIGLGYFFNKVFPSIASIEEEANINNLKIEFIGRFGTLGIVDREWPILKLNNSLHFKKEGWPIPIFKMQDPITERYFAVIYGDTLVNETIYPIEREEAEKLFSHTLYGHVSLEKKLDSILKR